jgi:hypothetical protein
MGSEGKEYGNTSSFVAFWGGVPTAFQKAENIALIFRGLSPPVSPRRAMVSQYTF